MQPKRQCGDCTLCCRLLPVPPLNKVAGVKCQFARHGRGCTVHDTPKQPTACKIWHCRWLVNDDAADLPRPDRSHYVIDMLPDQLSIVDDDDGTRKDFVAIQIWADPKFPDAWKECKTLRAWIVRKAALGFPTMIRHGSRSTIGVFAPPITGGEWFISGGTIDENMGLWK